MKKFMSFCMGTALLLGAVAGCGKAESMVESSTAEYTSGKDASSDVETNASGDAQDSEVSGTAQASSEDVDEIVIAFPILGTHTQAAVERVTEAINEISIPAINTSVTLTPVELANYGQQMSLRLSAGEQLDLMPTFYFGPTTFSSMLSQKQLMPLNDLLDEYGQDIVDLLPDYFLKTTTFDGNIYAVPAYKDLVSNVYVCMRKDILEETGLEEAAKNIQSMDDLEAIYEKVVQETDVRAVASDASNGVMAYLPVLFENEFSQGVHYDELLTDAAYAMEGDSDTVVSLYNTEIFEDVCRRTRDWYDKGYIYINESGDLAQSYANSFSIFLVAENATYMSGLSQAMSLGYDYEIVKIGSAMVSTSTVNTISWVIPVNSKYPEAAMKFLTLMYTNKEIVDLLNYGQKDIDYVVLEDGTYDFPEGMDANNCQYNDNLSWLFGNQYLSGVWTGADPDTRKISAQINAEAQCSPLLGFTVDTTGIENEIATVSNVYNEYFRSLSSGLVDVDTELPAFRQKLSDNGLDIILENVQQQLDEWKAEQ